MRRAICHPQRPNHDGKGRCWECATPNTADQQVSQRRENCFGQPLVRVPHARRGLLLVDEVIAPLVARMWQLGFDVESRESSHSFAREGGHGQFGDALLEFRDQPVRDSNPGVDMSLTLAERLRRLLLAVEPDLAEHSGWVWGNYLLAGGVRSYLTLPEEDLPLFSELLARVEAQAADGLELGLPLSASTTYELMYCREELNPPEF